VDYLWSISNYNQNILYFFAKWWCRWTSGFAFSLGYTLHNGIRTTNQEVHFSFNEYTDWLKNHATIPDTYSICQKINYIEIKKQCYINVHRVKRCMHSLFSSCLMQRNDFCPAHFLCHRNGSPGKILLICLAQENQKMYP
jgi:hypothetical protein